MFEVSKLQAWEVHSLKVIITLLSFIKDTSAWSLIKMKSCMPGRDGCYAGGEQPGRGEELQRQGVHQEERPEGTDHQQDGKADEAVDEAVEGPLEAAEEQCQ